MNDIAHIESGNSKGGLVRRMAQRFGVDETKLLSTLKNTAFRVKNGEATNEQMMALMVVADQYRLNPFTKEIYAFPDKQNGIVPVVGVDGWSRIINEHPEFDGMDFRQSEDIVTMEGAKPCPEWIECVMYRKDRQHPIVVREYLDECYREPFTGQGKNGSYQVTGPWQTHTKRFLRHKTMIQASRIAFGFAGIYDPDEAERINESQAAEARVEQKPARPERQALSDEDFQGKAPEWKGMIEAGQQTPENIIAIVESRYALTDEQRQAIHDLAVADAEYTETEGDEDAHTES